MIKRNLYFKDGVLFADGYERVVHGGRGDYVELAREQIQVSLQSHFKQELPLELSDEEFFYYWLEPTEEKKRFIGSVIKFIMQIIKEIFITLVQNY